MNTTDLHLSAPEFQSGNIPTWCPGCGNFAMWTALNHVFAKLKLEPHQIVVVFDIGCVSNGANWIKAYTFHGLHGRSLPLATGIALANHGLKTIVISGDGGAYGEGLNHFIQTVRANPDITYIVEDNQLYSLTKGQTSPTTAKGMKTDSAPGGVIEEPLNPLTLALAAGASFVARGFAGDLPHLEGLIEQAIRHRGFSYIDVFQPCVTFNHLNTYAWFFQQVKKLESMNHDPTDKTAAMKQAQETQAYMPIGLLYHNPARPVLQDALPVLAAGPLVERRIDSVNLSALYSSYT